jgi:hypothetical protein
MPRPDTMTIPGAGTMTRRGPSMMPGASIWPEWQKGLLSDKQMNEVMPHFAGGIYGEGGYQVRTPANPQSFGLLGAGDPRVWGGTAAENIMAQPQPPQSMQPVQSQGLLAQPTGQGGNGLLSNNPNGQLPQEQLSLMANQPQEQLSLRAGTPMAPEPLSLMPNQPQGVDPMAGNQIRPVTPSGIWDVQPDPSVTSDAATAPGFTNRQVFEMMNGHLLGGDPMETAGQRGVNMQYAQHLMNGGNGGANGGVFGSEGNGGFSPVGGFTEEDWDTQYDPSNQSNMADWYTSYIRNNSGPDGSSR